MRRPFHLQIFQLRCQTRRQHGLNGLNIAPSGCPAQLQCRTRRLFTFTLPKTVRIWRLLAVPETPVTVLVTEPRYGTCVPSWMIAGLWLRAISRGCDRTSTCLVGLKRLGHRRRRLIGDGGREAWRVDHLAIGYLQIGTRAVPKQSAHPNHPRPVDAVLLFISISV